MPLRLSCELIMTGLAAAESAAVFLELGPGHGGESVRAVVLGLVVVDFVDGLRGVHDRGLDSLLLDHGLDVLVDVVVDVLASDSAGFAVGVLDVSDLLGVLKLSLFLLETLAGVIVVVVLEGAVLDWSHLVGVLLREDFLVLDGLHSGVVVILVNLTVDGSLGLVVLGPSYVLVLHSWAGGLVDGGIILSVFVEESLNC